MEALLLDRFELLVAGPKRFIKGLAPSIWCKSEVTLKSLDLRLEVLYGRRIRRVQVLHDADVWKVERVGCLGAAKKHQANLVSVASDNFRFHEAESGAQNGIDATR